MIQLVFYRDRCQSDDATTIEVTTWRTKCPFNLVLVGVLFIVNERFFRGLKHCLCCQPDLIKLCRYHHVSKYNCHLWQHLSLKNKNKIWNKRALFCSCRPVLREVEELFISNCYDSRHGRKHSFHHKSIC